MDKENKRLLVVIHMLETITMVNFMDLVRNNIYRNLYLGELLKIRRAAP
jgi:hypothetical protein